MRTLFRCASAVLLLLLAAPLVSAQYLGEPQCKKCHGLAERQWMKYHQKSLAQLSDPKAKTYAAAVGGNATNARCIDCHSATRVGGASDPVSCESCHGAGGVYLKPHQKANWAGLTPIFNDAGAVAKLCVECHVLASKDGDIAATGHPTGRDFAFGDKLRLMKHWPSDENELTRPRTYDASGFYAKVAAAAGPMVARRGGAAPPKTAGGAPAPPAGPGGAPKPAVGSVGSVGGTGAAPRPAARPAASDDEYADLGDDEFRSPASVPRRSESGEGRESGGIRPPQTPPAASGPANAVGAGSRAPAPPVAPPIRALPKTPAPDVVPAYAESPVIVRPAGASAATPAITAAAPMGPLGVPAVRGLAASALVKLVRAGKPGASAAPRPPTNFEGRDGELLVLQDEVMALALELLAKRPAPAAAPATPATTPKEP